MPLISFTERGIYCERGDFYIDPWRPVGKALITHGHADHSRPGHGRYLATDIAAPVIRQRLGASIALDTTSYGDRLILDGVEVSFHPAGHIVGSAQIRVAYKGEVWVIGGDHKLVHDGIATPFEPVQCDHFVCESTFGLPVYRWKPQTETMSEINAWWRENADAGVCSVIAGYALGKAQRILQGVDPSIGAVFTHGAVEAVNATMRAQGIDLRPTEKVTAATDRERIRRALVIATPAATGSPWAKKLMPMSIGLCSGWMSLRGPRRRRSVDRGFVLSDHADWGELLQTVEMTGAEHVYVTHGYTSAFARYLREERGLDAKELQTEFEGELEEIGEGATRESEGEGAEPVREPQPAAGR